MATKDVAYVVDADGQRYRLKAWSTTSSQRVGSPSCPATLQEKDPDGGWEFLKSWEMDISNEWYTELEDDETVLVRALEWLESVLGVEVDHVKLSSYAGSRDLEYDLQSV